VCSDASAPGDKAGASAEQAQEHVPVDGATLTAEQQFEAELQHVEHQIQSDVVRIGELLLPLGGDHGVITGELSEKQIQTTISRMRVAAEKVRQTRVIDRLDTSAVLRLSPDMKQNAGVRSWLSCCFRRDRVSSRAPRQASDSVLVP
jgi:hypothetical protein